MKETKNLAFYTGSKKVKLKNKKIKNKSGIDSCSIYYFYQFK